MLQKKKEKLVNGGLMGGSNQLLYLKKEFWKRKYLTFIQKYREHLVLLNREPKQATKQLLSVYYGLELPMEMNGLMQSLRLEATWPRRGSGWHPVREHHCKTYLRGSRLGLITSCVADILSLA